MTNYDYSYLDDPFSEAKTENNERFPVGKCILEVAAVEVGDNKAGDKKMFKWDLKYIQSIDGDTANADRHLFPSNVLPGRDAELKTAKMQMSFLKRGLAAVGVPVEDPEFSLNNFLNNVNDCLNSVLDVQFEATIKYKDAETNYPDIYFNKFIGKAKTKPKAAPAADKLAASADEESPAASTAGTVAPVLPPGSDDEYDPFAEE
jgi:hypothetical protein